MPNTFNSSTFSSTYRDDYNDSDNYHRILYNSGRALQARELTQMQTIIQEEMARFGRNIFKDGARVSAGGITVDNDRKYVKISGVTSGGAFSDIQVGTVFTGQTNNYVAKVLDVKPIGVDGFTANTLYLQYIGANGASGTPTTATAVFAGGETISGGGYDLVVDNAAGGVGSGTKLIVGEGSYFILGHFVFSPKQEIFLEAYSQNANAKVVFEVTEDIITVNDTQDLYDNTNVTPNLASPGADRYRIRMTLKKEGDVSAGASSVYLCTVQNSRVSEEIPVFDGYNQIKHMIAQRTREESGNYVVNPFLVQFEDRVQGDDNIDLIVNPGIAYVNGYRVQNQYAKRLALPRATATELVQNESVRTLYGNYVKCDTSAGLPDFGSVTLFSGNSGTGSIGTAYLRSYAYESEIPGAIRAYIYDIRMNTGQDFKDVQSIGNSGTDYVRVIRESGITKLYGTENNRLLFKTPRSRPATFSDISITVQRRFTDTANGSGIVGIPAVNLTTGEQFADFDGWLIANITDNTAFELIPEGDITPGLGLVSANIDMGVGNAGKNFEVYAYVKRDGILGTKTRTDTTVTGQALSTDAVSGFKYYEFPQVDVFEIVEVRETNNSGNIITDSFLFDNGVTDNAYYQSRLVLKEGRTAPASIYVSYKYWARGGSGNFYTGTSYQGVDIDYTDVPNHKLKSGTVINLRNYLDFRPDYDFSNFGSKDQIELPRSGDTLLADIEYYTPRADKLLITQEGELKVLMGAQAENPQFKETPDNALELYKIIVNGFTLDENDLSVQSVEHKRYTMKDIAKLEKKFDQFAATTQLSLLELEAKISQLFDSDGTLRVDVGIKVDDFSDQGGTDTEHSDNNSSIDPETRTLRAGFDEDNIRLVYDSATSTAANAQRFGANYGMRGDMVGIKYNNLDWQTQPLASQTLQVNPAGLIRNIGCVHLSPSSDEWKEVIYDAVPAQSGNTNVSGNTSYLWNEWQWNWAGRQSEASYTPNFYTGYLGGSNWGGGGGFEGKGFEGDYYASEETLNPDLSSNYVSRPLQNDTVREVFDNTTVDVALVPWIRSRKVYFRASGLKPDTRFTPFFDGVNVADWCKKEAYVAWGDRSEDIGNQYQNITQHPDTPSDLFSDANGELEGSFVIPNVRPTESIEGVNSAPTETEAGLRFRSGIKEFKLVDVTVTDITSAGSSASSYYVAKGAFERQTPNVTSTRPVESTWSGPQVFPGHIFPYYNSRELQNLANAVTAGEFYMIEPHPSGQWAAGDAAANPATYDASNTMSQLLSDYVTVDENQYAGSVDLPTPITNNPMAQSFYVDNQFGLTLTQIKLFFAKKDANLPVQIQIRPMEDGAPSIHEIVPNSCVFKNSADVTETLYTPGSTLLSTVQGAPTTFEFMEPVYLKPFTNYALIVSSESPEYEVYVAKALNYVIGPTGSQRILSQPAPGEMFLPQTGTQWLPSKDYDLMYTMVRAQFDTNASVVLGNADVPGKLLKTNPIITTLGSSEIFVQHPNHGLDSAAPDSLILTVQGSLSAAGLTEADLNGTHTVIYADAKGVVVDVGTAATASTSIGGDAIIASRNIQFGVANPYLETLIPPGCSIDVTGKFTTGRSLREGNAETKYVKDGAYTRITPGQNINFNAPRLVADPSIQTAELGAGVKSIDVKLNMTSANDYVSPMIDLQRASMYLVANEIDNDTRDEAQPWMGDDNGGSRQIGEVISVAENPASGAQLTFDANLPTGTSQEVYIRTSAGSEVIEDQPWVLQQPVTDIAPSSGPFTSQRVEYLYGGQGGLENEFTQFQHKIVMKSSNLAATPEIRNLSIKFLGL